MSEEKRPDFKVGDVVRLYSGGAHMTVEAIGEDSAIGCVWWYEGAFCRETLAGALLYNQTIRDEWDREIWREQADETARRRSAELQERNLARQAEMSDAVKASVERTHRWRLFN